MGYTETQDVAIYDEVSGSSATVTAGRLETNARLADVGLQSFIVTAEDIQIGNNKSMISILNTTDSTVVVKIRDIRLINTQNAGITGIVAKFDILRFTGHSAGTLLTPQAHDTADTLNSSVTVRTGATITGETAGSLTHVEWSTDEWGPGAPDVESQDHAMQLLTPFYKHDPSSSLKAITLRAGQGIHVKQTVNSTAGTFDIMFSFTQE